MTNPRISRAARSLAEADSVVVLGLGRFGSAVAHELMRVGVEVLGIDKDPAIVQQHGAALTRVVQADTTSEEALRQVGVPEFDRAVVGIGIDIEASLLTASLLMEFGIEQVWAKAITDAHGKILTQLHVPHVVYPEVSMGRRMAHLVRGAMLDFIEFDDAYALVRTLPPAVLLGVPLGESPLPARCEVTVIAVRSTDGAWRPASAATVLAEGDQIVVAGPTRRAEQFSLIE